MTVTGGGHVMIHGYIEVTGLANQVWEPAFIGSHRYELTEKDIEKIGKLNEKNMRKWLRWRYADHFQVIESFKLTIEFEATLFPAVKSIDFR